MMLKLSQIRPVGSFFLFACLLKSWYASFLFCVRLPGSLRPGIDHFPKEPQFPFVWKVFRNQVLGSRNAYCYWNSIYTNIANSNPSSQGPSHSLIPYLYLPFPAVRNLVLKNIYSFAPSYTYTKSFRIILPTQTATTESNSKFL